MQKNKRLVFFYIPFNILPDQPCIERKIQGGVY